MDDAQVFHFAAGGKRQMPLSPDVAKAIAAARAQKNQREGSPLKGLNPTALAFHPSAAAEQSVQQIGDAAFTRTFSRPASSAFNGRDSTLPQVEHSGHSAPAGIISGSSDAG